MNYKLEEIKELDAGLQARVLALWEQVVPKAYAFMDSDDLAKLRAEMTGWLAYGRWLAVFADGALAGFVVFERNDLKMIVVDDNFRMRGIGKLLLEHAVANYGLTDADVYVENTAAVRFLEHMGFERCDDVWYNSGNDEYLVLFMSLKSKTAF